MTRIQSLPATSMLMLVLNNSSIAFSIEGRADQRDIEIYTNNVDQFNKDIEVSQKHNITAIAVLVHQNPKYNITNRGFIQGQTIGDFQQVTQHFHGNVIRQEVTSSFKVTIVVPENIDISVYNGVNVTIKGVKGRIGQ